jgi:glycosyltransferase involved in cell wall biosynthesis
MRIVVLSFTSGQIDRGVETIVREVTSRWQKKHQVKVISAQSLGMKVDYKKMSQGSWWRILMIDYFHFKIFWFTLKALREVSSWGEVKVLMPVNGGWQSLLCRLYCWSKKIKLVIPGLAGLGWCDRWNLYIQPDVFVASTKRNADWARRYNKRVKIETIPHGVDLTRFKPEGRKKEVKLKRPIVLCVAGPDKYKRVEATIKAVAKLKKASLLLVGGSEGDGALGKKLLGERFLRLKVSYEELNEVYRMADVFTMVSESSEEFGIVNLEALASGLPVVATDDRLRHEILGEHGIYVKDVWGQDYVDSLKKALLKVTNLAKKQRPEKWLEQFSWDRIADDYLSVFR